MHVFLKKLCKSNLGETPDLVCTEKAMATMINEIVTFSFGLYWVDLRDFLSLYQYIPLNYCTGKCVLVVSA